MDFRHFKTSVFAVVSLNLGEFFIMTKDEYAKCCSTDALFRRFGMIQKNLEWFRMIQKDGMIRKYSEKFISKWFKMFHKDSGRCGMTHFRMIQNDSERFRKLRKDSEWFRKIQDNIRNIVRKDSFRNVPLFSRVLYSSRYTLDCSFFPPSI